ncbi:BlaI/MecI/CopY family transcriptional regulator [Gryllotalpicola protaetiae]|uniref:Transcriptional regulator n=1 Tax=Gryllotalpicola protaetiae TaxID=2419771 RepID=A0A387C2X1_9MICO|nr:BlaI/MecI/CopY family transcriptional regulator [Gryllotalpicola protaetiae]AYG04891.1 transcriptional regulator [Gryllotalpicola protaetiae]
MASLGELERAVMDLLWQSPTALAAAEVRETLPGSPAITTVLTVLTRLEAKGFVSRDRSRRPHLFGATLTRDDYMAELMHEVLGSSPDREAVLARFVGRASKSETDHLRKLLGS